MSCLVEISLAIILSNFYEWAAHKYVLHSLGKKKGSFFHFHWAHHKNVRRYAGWDYNYKNLRDSLKEIFLLLTITIVNVSLFWHFPIAAMTMVVYVATYYFIHRKAHLDVKWGKKWIPWHFDHHMGKDQDLNWCVLFPMWDYILGTRKKTSDN